MSWCLPLINNICIVIFFETKLYLGIPTVSCIAVVLNVSWPQAHLIYIMAYDRYSLFQHAISFYIAWLQKAMITVFNYSHAQFYSHVHKLSAGENLEID